MNFLVSIGTMVPACGTCRSSREQTSRPLSSKVGHEAEGSVPNVFPSPPNWCQCVRFAWQTADDTYEAAFHKRNQRIALFLLLLFFMWYFSFDSGWFEFPAVERKLQVRLMLRSRTLVWSNKSAASCSGDVWKEVVSAPRRAPAADAVRVLKLKI